MADRERFPVEDCRQQCLDAYRRNGVGEANAARATEQFILCDLLGVWTHGVLRLSHYIGRIQVGGVDPAAEITVDRKTPSLALVDGHNTVGTAVATVGLETAMELAREAGIGMAGCINSNHAGANASYGWLAAQQGLVLISATSSYPSMPAPGGKSVVVGNSPIGFAAPRGEGRPPFIIDFALSVASRAKIRRARELGEPIPEGWGLDADGHPTTDPGAVLNGFALPVGGHKGYGLSMAIEMLSAILWGGRYGPQLKSQFTEADEPSGVCQYFIAIDPEKTIGRTAFEAEMDGYCRWITSQPAADPAVPVRVPGERAAAAYEENLVKGILVDTAHFGRNKGLADGTVKGEIPQA